MEKVKPYIKMMRLTHQATSVVAFLFGVMDANFTVSPDIIWLTTGLLSLSISIFILNDYVDALDTDKFSVQNRANTTTRGNKNIILFLWLLFAGAGAGLLLRYGLYWQAIASLVFSFLYNWPPFRLKARFLYDMLAMFVFFIFIPYSIPFSLIGQTFASVIQIPFLALTAFLGLAEGVHLLADLEADKKARLNSTNVVLGYHNLLKVLIILSFAAALGFTYLVYHHSHIWYWPLGFFSLIAILALGYARGNVYNIRKIEARFSWAKTTAVSLGNWILVYQAVLIYWLLFR